MLDFFHFETLRLRLFFSFVFIGISLNFIIYVGGSEIKVTRALTGANIPRRNEIPCLDTTDDHSNEMPPVDGASSKASKFEIEDGSVDGYMVSD